MPSPGRRRARCGRGPRDMLCPPFQARNMVWPRSRQCETDQAGAAVAAVDDDGGLADGDLDARQLPHLAVAAPWPVAGRRRRRRAGCRRRRPPLGGWWSTGNSWTARRWCGHAWGPGCRPRSTQCPCGTACAAAGERKARDGRSFDPLPISPEDAGSPERKEQAALCGQPPLRDPAGSAPTSTPRRNRLRARLAHGFVKTEQS